MRPTASVPTVTISRIKGRPYTYVVWSAFGKKRRVYCGVDGAASTARAVRAATQVCYLEQAETHLKLARQLRTLARRVKL